MSIDQPITLPVHGSFPKLRTRDTEKVQSRFAETRFAETRFAETLTLTLTLNPNP